MNAEFQNVLKLVRLWIGLCVLLFSTWAYAITYTYDNLNRLTAVNYGNGTTISYSYDAAGNRLTTTAVGVPACDLDVDGDGSRLAFKDGILILRYMLNIRGAGLLTGLTLTGPRTTPATIEPFIAAQNYNVDAGSTAQQAFVDGIILLRLMLNVGDVNLLNGLTIPAGAAFTTAAAIRANVNATCGTSF